MKSPRVVSLFPAATELLFAAGAGGSLVGRSHACDFPPEALAAPVLTRSRIPAGGSSAEVDAAVKGVAASGRSLFELDAAGLRAAAPDVILVQDQCALCAVAPADVAAALGGAGAGRPEIVSLNPTRFTDLWPSLQRVADAAGRSEEGRKAAAVLKGRVADILFALGEVEAPVSVGCIDWVDPLMAAGHWVPDLASMAGGEARCSPAGTPSAWLTWEQLAAWDPAALWVAPCGLDVEAAAAAWRQAEPRWGRLNLRAVRTVRVFVADGAAGFNRPGPRLVESLEAMAEALHPRRFPKPARRGRWWRPV